VITRAWTWQDEISFRSALQGRRNTSRADLHAYLYLFFFLFVPSCYYLPLRQTVGATGGRRVHENHLVRVSRIEGILFFVRRGRLYLKYVYYSDCEKRWRQITLGLHEILRLVLILSRNSRQNQDF